MSKVWSMVLFSWNSCCENDFEKYYSQTFQNITCLSILSSFKNDLHYRDSTIYLRLFLIIFKTIVFVEMLFELSSESYNFYHFLNYQALFSQFFDLVHNKMIYFSIKSII
jgi:hypothetical protein